MTSAPDHHVQSSGKKEFVRFLEDSGHNHLFGLPGSCMAAPLHELQNSDIQFVPAIHESVAIAAADGYSRVAGSAVCILYMLPGLANGLANLYNAWRDESPLTVIAAQQSSEHRSVSATIGEGDLVGMARPFTRFAHELALGMNMRFWLERAHSVSTGPQPGPVFLSMPENVFDEECEAATTRATKHTTAGPHNVSIVLEALAAAEKPLIVVGGQLRRFGGAEAIEELSSMLGIAIAYEPGFQDRLGVAPGHENLMGNILITPELEASADFVLVLGARLLLEAHPRAHWFANANFLGHVNADPAKLEETRKADWAIAGDPGAFAEQLLADCKAASADKGRIELRQAWLNSLKKPKAPSLDPTSRIFADYATALNGLSDAMERGWVVDEAVMGSPILQSILSAMNGRRYIGTTGASLGWGPGAAVGVALASGEPVTCVVGDGALRFGALGLWSIREQNLPITLVVLDNGGYGSTRYFERQYLAKIGAAARPQHPGYAGSDFRETGSTVESLLSGFGIPSVTVPEGGDSRAAIARAWGESADGPNAVVLRLPFGD